MRKCVFVMLTLCVCKTSCPVVSPNAWCHQRFACGGGLSVRVRECLFLCSIISLSLPLRRDDFVWNVYGVLVIECCVVCMGSRANFLIFTLLCCACVWLHNPFYDWCWLCIRLKVDSYLSPALYLTLMPSSSLAAFFRHSSLSVYLCAFVISLLV